MQEILKYQELDLKLKKLENELNSSANKKSAGEMQQYLRDGQTRLVKLEETAKVLVEQYQKATALYNDFVNKLEALAKEVDGGIKENVEAMLKKFSADAEKLDNHIINLANKIAAVNKEFESLMNNAKKARNNLEIYKANFAKEKAKYDPEIEKLKKELEAQKKKVDQALLQKYLVKAEGKNVAILVPETNGRCGGCRMEISGVKLSTLKAKGMIECENCGRIIYS